MTNFEWLKKEIVNMNEEELFCWKINQSPWCADIKTKNKGNCRCRDCKGCASQWLKSKYEEPMPELRTGMFVEVENCGFGVVVNDEIVFQNGTHGEVEYLKRYIVKVFETYCFMSCEDDVGIIWERNQC